MIFNDTVSILDTAEDDNGNLRIIQYVLRGVYLETSAGVTLDRDGEKRAYNCTLFVPSDFNCTESYVDRKTWEDLLFANKLNAFTFRPEQLIVGTGQTLEYNSLDDVMNNEPICYQVLGVDYLTKVLPHFEVLGK